MSTGLSQLHTSIVDAICGPRHLGRASCVSSIQLSVEVASSMSNTSRNTNLTGGSSVDNHADGNQQPMSTSASHRACIGHPDTCTWSTIDEFCSESGACPHGALAPTLHAVDVFIPTASQVGVCHVYFMSMPPGLWQTPAKLCVAFAH